MHALTSVTTNRMSMVSDQQAQIFIENARREGGILSRFNIPEVGPDSTVFRDEAAEIWVLEPLTPGAGDSVVLFDQDKTR